MSIYFIKYFTLLLIIVLFLLTSTETITITITTDTQLNIPSETTTTNFLTCTSCKVDTSMNTINGYTYKYTDTYLESESIFTTFTDTVISYKTTAFFSTITKIFRGYTTTYITTVNSLASPTERYVLPSTIVVVKKVTAAILFVSTTAKPTATVTVNHNVTVTPADNDPRFLKPFMIGFGTGTIGVVVICITIFVFSKRRNNNILRIAGSR
ncbi:hypothetical protein Glove_168g202 [Diversispora epigaea]|uniref:Mid2 domain-containing protein n=1 Tax=Diversispora epigaea TaxID=1348612 RepID=A0A397IUP1_9GLOM|nr:hypothetical protein Glove_168g204 [Diversispora epigaea]RHZ78069.1 hypothetical protein Glove_168g202 [Diversispora epigaea]